MFHVAANTSVLSGTDIHYATFFLQYVARHERSVKGCVQVFRNNLIQPGASIEHFDSKLSEISDDLDDSIIISYVRTVPRVLPTDNRP